jgi:hypothetical protein
MVLLNFWQQKANITMPNSNGEEAIRAGSTETYI